MDWVEGPSWFVELGEAGMEGVLPAINTVVSSQRQTSPGVERVFRRCTLDEVLKEETDRLPERMYVEIGPDRALDTATLDQLEQIASTAECWISAKWTTHMLQQVLEIAGVDGIVLSGSSESEVGVKDFEEMDAFFEVIHHDL